MQKAHGTPAIDLADVLGFTIGFCFLPSALCLMAVLLLTYFERPRRLEGEIGHRGNALVFKPSHAREPVPGRASPERFGGLARQDDAARGAEQPTFQRFRLLVAQPRC